MLRDRRASCFSSRRVVVHMGSGLSSQVPPDPCSYPQLAFLPNCSSGWPEETSHSALLAEVPAWRNLPARSHVACNLTPK